MSTSKKHQSLSKALLTRVLSVYFVITLTVTFGQVVAEYFNAKSDIVKELTTLQNTFSASLTRSMWELNTPQAITIAEGLVAVPVVAGVVINDENGNNVLKRGIYPESDQSPQNIFGYTFPLIFEFSGRAATVGDVTLYSTRETVIERIKITIFFVLGNAVVKTTFLILLFVSAFRKLLSEPLTELSEQIEQFTLDDLVASKVNITSTQKNELTQIQLNYNALLDDLALYKTQLNKTQGELKRANHQLDEQNLQLEQEVAKKTANLSKAMLDLEKQKKQLEEKTHALKIENERHKFTQQQLRDKNQALEGSMQDLKQAQDQLLESERLASLGGLVAGIAHDVNTPIGVSVTATSFLNERVSTMQKAFADKKLTASQMEQFLADASQSTNMLMSNLNRASELVASFKQVAVDQTSNEIRAINVVNYLGEIIQSLHPKLKHTKHNIDIDCDKQLVIKSYPGVLAQIFTNLIMNSIIHGFADRNDGQISIQISHQNNHLSIKYKDNGVGVDQEGLVNLFEAFYTTRREMGGSGLGTHIMYNLVRQSLQGKISASSEPGQGLSYEIEFPVERGA